MKKKLFVVDKKMRLKILEEIVPFDFECAISIPYMDYCFDYSVVSLNDFPFYDKEVKYSKSNYLEDVYGINGNTSILYNHHKINKMMNKIAELDEFDELIDDYFNLFDEVICATDLDRTGLRAFELKMQCFFHLGKNWKSYFKKKNIKITILNTDRESNIELDKRTEYNKSTSAKKYIDEYKKKDFIDYNFNANSFLYYKNFLDKDNMNKNSENFISRNGFIALNELKNKIKRIDFIHLMSKKKIGSATSKHAIIHNLIKLNLVKEFNFNKTTYLQVTKKGDGLLNNLSPEILNYKPKINEKTPFKEFKKRETYNLKKIFKFFK